MGGGAVLSNSKIGLTGLAYQEGTVKTRSELQLLDEHRNINVPWVSDLTPSQIVQLREEASKALPIFRETLAKCLAASPAEQPILSAKDTIHELRQQAVEVRNEIANTQQHAARFWKASYIMLGFSVSAYGLVNDEIGTAATGLLPLLQLITDHKAGREKDMDRLQRRPGYVLVKAQDILAHGH
ncbi:MAG: hypothetical protein K0S36_1365 [Nitrosospira multiformis]|jgi:hypothetical protein|nr:hypothetical protein [Nitrosospira multiformis]